MIHSFAKLVSKILALRLAPKLDMLIDKNQNTFIRERTIQDNFKYIQRASVLIRKKKVPHAAPQVGHIQSLRYPVMALPARVVEG
jgi:hypothetical protein